MYSSIAVLAHRNNIDKIESAIAEIVPSIFAVLCIQNNDTYLADFLQRPPYVKRA
jgi:hypothetical protein